MRRLAFALVLASAGAAFLAGGTPAASAGGQDQPHLDYRKTYAEALLEARIRNVCVLVSRHKDD